MKNKHYLINRNYELGDHSLFRQFHHLWRMRTGTMGWDHYGPGFKNLLVLFVYQFLGRPLFRLHAWFLHQPRLRALLDRFVTGQ